GRADRGAVHTRKPAWGLITARGAARHAQVDRVRRQSVSDCRTVDLYDGQGCDGDGRVITSHVDDGRATLVVAYDGGDGSVVLRILHLHGKPTHAAVHEGDLAVDITGERHFAAVIACTDAVVHFDKVSGQVEALRPERRGACRFDAGNGG